MWSLGEFSTFRLNENLNKKWISLWQKNENSVKALFSNENDILEIRLNIIRQIFVLYIFVIIMKIENRNKWFPKYSFILFYARTSFNELYYVSQSYFRYLESICYSVFNTRLLINWGNTYNIIFNAYSNKIFLILIFLHLTKILSCIQIWYTKKIKRREINLRNCSIDGI